MKTSFLFILMVAAVFCVSAQTLTNGFLSQIPALPKDSCGITRVAAESFRQKVSELQSKIAEQISAIKKTNKENAPANEAAAKAGAMKQMAQFGLSPEEMSKISGGKMSAADKKELANKMMQQQTNMSVGEVQNMQKMSESGKKAYAEALGTEMMATSQAGGNQPANTNNVHNLNQLLSQQQSLMNKISVVNQKIENFYNGIETDSELNRSHKKISNWATKISDMVGVDYGQGDKMDSLALLIKNEQIKICEKYTPPYRHALRQHISQLKASIPEIYQLGQVTAQITTSQTGIVSPPGSNEIECLESLKLYLNKLQNVNQFKLYFPEDIPQF